MVENERESVRKQPYMFNGALKAYDRLADLIYRIQIVN